MLGGLKYNTYLCIENTKVLTLTEHSNETYVF